MTGTEKQVAWAEDIKARFERTCDIIVADLEGFLRKQIAYEAEQIAAGKDIRGTSSRVIKDIDDVKKVKVSFEDESAAFWIENRSHFTQPDDFAHLPYSGSVTDVKRFIMMADGRLPKRIV